MTDAQLIDSHGGPVKLAEKLGWSESKAVQRIHNWKSRGIPAAVKLKFPAIFLSGEYMAPSAQAEPKTEEAANG